MPDDEAPTIELPADAVQAIWRIFGNGLAPLKEPTCYDLAAFIIRDQVGETEEAELIIDEIRSWFDPDGGPNHLRQDMKGPVAEMIIDGIRVELSGTSGIGNHDTAFWAMGSINPDLAASIIRSSWSPEEMDSFARYALDTLEYASTEKANSLTRNTSLGRERSARQSTLRRMWETTTCCGLST